MRKGPLLLSLSALLVALESHAATFSVSATADSGPGSLRQAIIDANTSSGFDEIRFATTEGQPFRIVVTTALPEITDPLVIDGRTAAGFNGVPIVELSGNNRDMSHGLKLGPGASGSSIFALAINGFGANIPSHGIWFADSDNNLVDGCRIGVNTAGDTALRNRGDGIVMQASEGNRILNSIISGNRSYGVHILGPGANGNEVSNCAIGLNAAKAGAIGNSRAGIGVEQAIGTKIQGNTIAGNTGPQIEILGNASAGTLIYGNFIGTKGDGTALAATPASAHGIRISGAPQTVIGGTALNQRNIISGNQFGISVSDAGANGTIIQNNFIGLDATGSGVAGNHGGIYLGAASGSASVGGPTAAHRNVISGNRTFGISISDSSNNLVVGNYIGTDATGMAAVGNTASGTQAAAVAIGAVTGVAENNAVGGETANLANLISGNNDTGAQVSGGGARNNRILNNVIGLNADFSALLGNRRYGVAILGATDTFISKNVIMGNGRPPAATAPPDGNRAYALPTFPGVFVGFTFGGSGSPAAGTTVNANTVGFSGGAGISFLNPTIASENTFTDNEGLAVDVGNDGPTPPAASDPIVAFTFQSTNPFVFSGTVRGQGDCAYQIVLYIVGTGQDTPGGDPRAQAFAGQAGEVKVPVSVFEATTDASGFARFGPIQTQATLRFGQHLEFEATSICNRESEELAPIDLAPQAPTVIAFAAPVFNLKEGGESRIRIIRSGDTTQAASAEVTPFELAEGSSPWAIEANTGIQNVPTTIEFAPGQTENFMTFVLTDDELFAGTRVFGVRLSSPSNAALGLATATVFVADNEIPQPRFAFDYSEAPRPHLLVNGANGTPLAVEFTRDLTGGGAFEISGETGTSPFHPRDLFPPGQVLPQIFFRAASRDGFAVMDVDLAAGDGGAAEAQTHVFVGRGGEPLPNDGRVLGVPPGPISLQLEQRLTITDTVSGGSTLAVPQIFVLIRTDPGALEEVTVRSDFAVNLDPLTATSRRNPWAALAASIVGGEKIVTAAGGAVGDAFGIDSFLVRSPAGVEIIVNAFEPTRVFPNAESGAWTATTTVNGKSETATVIVP